MGFCNGSYSHLLIISIGCFIHSTNADQGLHSRLPRQVCLTGAQKHTVPETTYLCSGHMKSVHTYLGK